MTTGRALTREDIHTLEAAGCTSTDWAKIQISNDAGLKRLREVEFIGKVTIGDLSGTVELDAGAVLPAEIRNATIVDCEIGDNVRITNVGGCLANYKIGKGAVISNVGTVATAPGAAFGNGFELEAHNEGGGREVPIFNELSSQFAYLLASHRYRPRFVKALEKMVEDYVVKVKADRGVIGEKAVVRNVQEIIDVNIGPYAKVSGAALLKNGTILSEEAAPATVGAAVIAEDFIIAEGSKVDSGAILTGCFVGQSCKVGRQFSAENSLFFANCECFHSEAVAVFAGPYTVTHHRSSLLIAAMFSFFNAGSGTNQSNHMYKLGPVHQGRLERGSKTGSFSYMLWPCVVSPFSVVVGKNMASFDISEFPFSYVSAENDGSYLTPAMNLYTVGTRRDGEKWPNRDRRKGSVKRDKIRFEVFSPFVVGRMLRGEATLSQLAADTPKEKKVIVHNGIRIKRLMLRHSAKNYAQAIDMYLQDVILRRAGEAIKSGIDAVRKAFAADEEAVYSREWSDISGLLIAQDRLAAIHDAVESGKIASIDALNDALQRAWESYEADEWAWVREIYKERTGKPVEELSMDDLATMREKLNKTKSTFNKKILADAEKEFDDVARMGFGIDGGDAERDADFESIRGTFDGNSFAKKLQNEIEEWAPKTGA